MLYLSYLKNQRFYSYSQIMPPLWARERISSALRSIVCKLLTISVYRPLYLRSRAHGRLHVTPPLNPLPRGGDFGAQMGPSTPRRFATAPEGATGGRPPDPLPSPFSRCGEVCGRCSVIFLIVRLLWMIKPQTCQKKTGFAD